MRIALAAALASLTVVCDLKGQEVETYGAWIYGTESDPMTDVVTHVAYVRASGESTFGQPPLLAVVCREDDPVVSWNHAEIVFSLETSLNHEVLVRFDKGEVQTVYWDLENDFLGTVEPVEIEEFVSQLWTASRVVLRTTIGDERITQTFPLDGSSAALSRLSCLKGE